MKRRNALTTLAIAVSLALPAWRKHKLSTLGYLSAPLAQQPLWESLKKIALSYSPKPWVACR